MNASPQRAVILADVHLGLVGLAPDGRTYGDTIPVFRAAVHAAAEMKPQTVVLLGDLVNRGFPDEYERVKQILAPLDGRLEPVVGNHELQRAGVAEFEAAWGVPATREMSLCGLPAVVLNSGIEGLPDETWHGRLDPPSLEVLHNAVRKHREGPLVVLCHFPLAGTVRVSDEPMFALENSQEVSGILSLHRGPLVFVSGHTHTPSIVRRGRHTYLGCAPLGFWPNALLVLERAGDELRYSTVRLVNDPADSPDPRAIDPVYRADHQGEDQDRSGSIPLR